MQLFDCEPGYWEKLLAAGAERNALSYAEKTYLAQAAEFVRKAVIPQTSSGKVPLKTMTMVKNVIEIKNKLESLGIKV